MLELISIDRMYIMIIKNAPHFLDQKWSIDNSVEILDKLPLTPLKMQVFDFENLFTNIPIDSLYDVLMSIFDVFNINDELNINRDLFLSLHEKLSGCAATGLILSPYMYRTTDTQYSDVTWEVT